MKFLGDLFHKPTVSFTYVLCLLAFLVTPTPYDLLFFASMLAAIFYSRHRENKCH